MTNVTVTDTDTKKAKLTVTGKKEVRIKLNRHWDEATKTEVTNTLTKVAESVLGRNLGYTLRGSFNPQYPKILQMKSANKSSPKILNVKIEQTNEGVAIEA